MMARIVPGWDSEAEWSPSSAWPRKNDTNESTTESTSVTRPNTMPLAANITERRGITVSEVRIIPVEYSEVMTSAPSTAMTSGPRNPIPPRLVEVASNVALSDADMLCQLDLMTAQIRAENPTLSTTSTSIVHQVDRTDLSLVNSERTTPPNPARPRVADGTLAVMAAISGTPSHAGRDRRVVLDTVPGQFHERGLQRGPHHRQLVQPHAAIERDVPDLLGGDALHGQHPGRVARTDPPAGRGDRLGQVVGLR